MLKALISQTEPLTIARAIERFKTHPNAVIIKIKISRRNKFSFTEVSQFQIEKEIKNLNVKKSYNPQKYITETSATSLMVTVETLQQFFNQALSTGEFPSNLKNSDVTPVFIKKDLLNKENYRPVSVLPIILKVFEKLENQINLHIKSFSPP